jgi:dimethylhistidine N-methyltransferase
MTDLAAGTVHLIDQHPRLSDFRSEILAGLTEKPRSIHPKFFYDEEGSRLFVEITRLDEYYPTRVETSILRQYADEITRSWRTSDVLIELGSGSSDKVRILLDAHGDSLTYMPVDISQEHLVSSAASIAADYPHVKVIAVCSDYTTDLHIPAWESFRHRTLFFPGSTIGNLEPSDAKDFLSYLAGRNSSGDSLLIGVDLEKEPSILEAAYNDSLGMTAAFNLNVLRRINNEFGADFDLDGFEHVAFYNRDQHRIEMHLRSLSGQVVHLGETTIEFLEGETIHTENSYKYSQESFAAIVRGTGFEIARLWTDEDQMFGVYELEVE